MPRKKVNPDNHVTLICQNPECGKEFSRYKKLYTEGARVYCSNECAAKVTKAVHHVIDMETSTVLDSGWESLFWGLCIFLKIPIDRCDRSEAVEWTPGHFYCPDFKMGHTYVEVKGLEDDDDQEKWDCWNNQVGRLLVLDQKRLDEFRKFSRDELLGYSGAD